MALLGSCESKASIGLSAKHVEFGWRGDTVVVTTESAGWDIESVAISYDPQHYDTTGMNLCDRLYPTSASEIGTAGKTFDWLTVVSEEKAVKLIVPRNTMQPTRTFCITFTGDNLQTEQLTGSQREMMDGDWDDVIQANPKTLSAKAEGETLRITTESYWWICTIEAGDNVYHATSEEYRQCSDEKNFSKTVDWLTVKRDNNDVIVTVDANKTGKERTFGITLGEGDYYCPIKGTQKAE